MEKKTKDDVILKKHQVHLVSTDKHRANGLALLLKENLLQIVDDNSYLTDCPDDKTTHIAQEIYITSDEEIKEGDKVLASDNTVWEFRTKPSPIPYWTNPTTCKKIVATTNPKLWDERPFGSINTSKRGEIAKISSDFIEAYIKAYNEGDPIKEVILELQIDRCALCGDNPAYLSCPNVNCSVFAKTTRLKLRSDGSVIIHPIKEKKYTRDEVIEIINQFDEYIGGYKSLYNVKRWFDKNYPQ
jgi:hypothetical protein